MIVQSWSEVKPLPNNHIKMSKRINMWQVLVYRRYLEVQNVEPFVSPSLYPGRPVWRLSSQTWNSERPRCETSVRPVDHLKRTGHILNKYHTEMRKKAQERPVGGDQYKAIDYWNVALWQQFFEFSIVVCFEVSLCTWSVVWMYAVRIVQAHWGLKQAWN